MMKSALIFALALAVASVNAYSVAFPARANRFVARSRSSKASLRMENFGLPFAESQSANTPKEILGEVALKEKFVGTVSKDNLLTADYPVLTRVAEMGLLSKTAEAGILTALTEKGLTLSQLEKLLPVLEEYGLLSFAITNKSILLNLVAPILVEPAPLLLGPLAAALKAPPSLYLGAAAACAGLEGYGFYTDGSIGVLPVVGAALFGGLGLQLLSDE